MNLESRPLFLTKSVKTPSAAGLLQMLPKQTKRTEKGLVSVSVEVDIDALVAETDEREGVSFREFEGCFCFWRDEKLGRRASDWGLREE